MSSVGLFFTDERAVECRSVEPGPPQAGEVLVDTGVSAISAGTELLVYRNNVPDGMVLDETIPSLSETFSYPVQYGYAAVGTVIETGSGVDDSLYGTRVFAFEPHQSRFRTPAASIKPLPAGVSAAEGALLPTVETATNLVLDGNPRLGEEVVVFGAGAVGLCTTRLLSEFPLSELLIVEPLESRREAALEMGADDAVAPGNVADYVTDVDLAIELSGQPDTLDDAVGTVGYDGRVVVGSWYGTKRAPIDLGTRYHRNRIELLSSQVSTISPELRGRWDTDRRLETSLDWLERIDTTRLISHRVPIEDAAEAYRRLDRRPESALQVVLTYGGRES